MDRNMIIKVQILEWMQKNAHGFRNAKPRHEICDALVLEDRLLRSLCTDLKRAGHIATNSQSGYYFIPLVVINDPEEIEALKHSINDMRSRAFDLLETAKAMAARLEQKTTKQMELAV